MLQLNDLQTCNQTDTVKAECNDVTFAHTSLFSDDDDDDDDDSDAYFDAEDWSD